MPESNVVSVVPVDTAPATTKDTVWRVLTVTYKDPIHTLASGAVYLILAAGWGLLYNHHLLDWIKAAISTFHLSFGGVVQ